MPTREDKIAFIRQKMGGASGKSREDKIAFIRQKMGGENPQMQADSGISELESSARGAAQGATMGFADELYGGIKSIGKDIQSVFTGENQAGPKAQYDKQGRLQNVDELNAPIEGQYQEFRDEYRKGDVLAREANPKSFTAGEIGGGIATAFVPGSAAAKGASLLNLSARSGAAGLASGAGFSEEEDALGITKDALKSGAIGLAAPAVLKGAGKVLSKAGRGAKSTAERMAARALGAERGTIKKIGQKKVQEAGRYALDEGLLTPFANTDDVIARNQTAAKKGGKMMGEVYEAIDEAAASNFNPQEVAAKVNDELGGFYRSPINKGVTRQLDNTLEAIVLRGKSNISTKEAQILKEELGKAANWKNNLVVSDKEQIARGAYRVVSDALDEAVDKSADKIGKADLGKLLKKGRKLYSQSKTAEDLLANKSAREQGNKLVGLTDWALLGGGGAAGAVTGGASIPATAALYGAKKYGEKFGAQQAALGLDKGSKALAKAPGAMDAIARKSTLAPGIASSQTKKEKPLSGRDKWASQGLEKLGQVKNKAQLMNNPKAKKLLIQLSRLKPGSKAFNDVKSKILKDYK